MSNKSFPPAQPHGALEEVLPDIFCVPGTVAMSMGPLTFRFSRSMVVLRFGESLTLVNTMRLDESGLGKLESLGKVEHIVRLAGFHGMDDPFYKDRYDAKVWAVRGQVYAKGFNNSKSAPSTYFEPDAVMDEESDLPIPDARLIIFEGRANEGVLRLDRDGGILITGDALQNWNRVDRFFNTTSGLMMKVMGFIKPYNVGPGWLKEARPDRNKLRGLLDLEFDKVLPCHGAPVMSDARSKYTPAIEKAAVG